MRKSIVTLFLIAAAGSANAANNAQITVTANVVEATCDVSVSTSGLDLGNYAKGDFTEIATPLQSSVKKFTVGLSGCGTPALENDTAGLLISGQTLAGNPNMFNTTGTNTGIMFSKVSDATTYLKNGDKINLAKAGATPTPGDFNGKTVSLQAALASTSVTPDTGAVSAPILFSFAYN